MLVLKLYMQFLLLSEIVATALADDGLLLDTEHP